MDKLAGLQALRGMAALAIAVFHVGNELRGRPGTAIFGFLPWEAGVDVFFVISGFVMAYASGPLFGRSGGGRIFMARRVARIVPLYWLTTTAVLAVLAVRPDLMRSAVAAPDLVLASYLFVPWARPDGIVQPVYTLGWTLNYEMLFYVLFALAIGLGRRAAVATVSGALAALVGIGLALRPLPAPFGFWTSPLLIEFAFGLWLGLARAEGVVLGPRVRTGLGLAGLALLAFAGPDGPARTGLEPALLHGVPAACLVAACGLAPAAGPDGEAGWLARAGEALGDASYAIYLLHPFVIRAWSRVVDVSGLGPVLGVAGYTLFALAGTVATGLVVFRLLERPLTRRVRRALEPHRANGKSVASPDEIPPAAQHEKSTCS